MQSLDQDQFQRAIALGCSTYRLQVDRLQVDRTPNISNFSTLILGEGGGKVGLPWKS